MQLKSFVFSIFFLGLLVTNSLYADSPTLTLGAVTAYPTQRNVNITTIPYATDTTGARIPFAFCTNNTYFAQNSTFDPIQQINIAPGTYTWKFSLVTDGSCSTVFATKIFTLNAGDSLTFQPVFHSINNSNTQFILDEGKTSSNIITTPPSEIVIFKNSQTAPKVTTICVNSALVTLTNSILSVQNGDYTFQGTMNGVCSGSKLVLHVDAEKYYLIDTVLQINTTLPTSSSSSAVPVTTSSSQSSSNSISSSVSVSHSQTSSLSSVLGYSTNSSTKSLAQTGAELPLWVMLLVFGSTLTALSYLVHRSK